MAYSVRVDRIYRSGVPFGVPRVYEARDEAEALTIAAYEVDGGKPGGLRVATVKDAAGRLLPTYAGRASTGRA